MTTDPNSPYNYDDDAYDESNGYAESDEAPEAEGFAASGNQPDYAAAPNPPRPDDHTEGSFFEVRTFDTQTFEVVARTVTRSDPPAARPATSTPAPGSAAPKAALDLRAQTRTSSPSTRARRADGSSGGTRSRQKQRNRTRKVTRAASVWWSALRAMLIMVLAALLLSTIFSLWTSPTFFTDEFRAGLNQVQATQHLANIQPSPLPTDTHQVRIGIIIGHSGPPQDTSFTEDPGAVCPDGLKELDINTSVAQRVIAQMNGAGYTVDLMAEFDPQLENYLADVLLSIHTNDCQDYGDAGTGYSVAAASARQTTRGADDFLRECLTTQYGQTTGLPLHGEVTYDMSEYHNFDEVSPDTPTAIIELGFMNRDRAMLTGNPDIIAQGIVNGLNCFLGANNADAS